MVIWIYVDRETNNVTGWTGTQPPKESNLIEVETNDYEFDIKERYMACKYDEQENKVSYDESIYLEVIKDNREFELRQMITEKINEGFHVNINNKNLIFKPTPTNKAFLEQAYSLFTNKIISDTTLPFVNENGEEVLEKVIDSNIFEVWLLAYVNEEDMNKHLNNVVLPKLKEAKTVEEVNAVEW